MSAAHRIQHRDQANAGVFPASIRLLLGETQDRRGKRSSLPNSLYPFGKRMPGGGFEPPARGFQFAYPTQKAQAGLLRLCLASVVVANNAAWVVDDIKLDEGAAAQNANVVHFLATAGTSFRNTGFPNITNQD
jgi:hypothetical protein